MADFASLDGMGGNIPNASPNAERLSLTMPGDVITGTSMGMQALGSQNIRSDSINRRIVVNDGNSNRIFFGKIGTGTNDWGMKVSKTGINVDSATNDQLVFNSSQNIFKIVQTGTGVMPIASYSLAAQTIGLATANTQIAHNLGYTPICMGFVTGFAGTGQSAILPYTLFGGGVGASVNIQTFEVSADATYVYLTSCIYAIWASGATGTYNSQSGLTVKYYLLQETAN